MARNWEVLCENSVDEDYIDMEVSSSSFTCPPTHVREFEFPGSLDKECTTTSPADELFYKGNLLPLHLPPRLQMVQNLLQYTPSTTTTTTCFNTPLETPNISPSESFRVSTELTPDECFFECSDEMTRFIIINQKDLSSYKNLKHSTLAHKLKASTAYLKSLFGKSPATNGSCEGAVKKAKCCLNKCVKVAKKYPLRQITQRPRGSDKDGDSHKRSHSLASNNLSFSSSCSLTSSYCELHLLKRGNSVKFGIDNSVEGAIAHCKQSQKIQDNASKTTSEVASRIPASEHQPLCRG